MTTEPAEIEDKLRRMRRRHKRLERQAWADGFLTGVCGLLRPGDITIDLGANAGDVSSRLLATGADVIAFDPEPWAVEKLQQRFDGNDRFTLHNAAVGAKAGVVQLHRASDFDSNAASASVKSTVLDGGRAIGNDNSVEVEMIDFVTFLSDLVAKEGRIAFLKMDIEGAELDLLNAMEEADLIHAVRCIVVETHERKFKSLRRRYRQLRERLQGKYDPTHLCLDWI